MGEQRCISCKKKMHNSPSLLCEACYEQYKTRLQQPRQTGICPICGGSVTYSDFYAKAWHAGDRVCSDKCRRIARVVKHRMRKEGQGE